MKDLLYSGRLEALDIAIGFAVTTNLANEAILKHDCSPVSGHILGRALTAGLLSAASLGEGERINIRWQYEGHLRTLLVDAGADQTVRGFVSPKGLSRHSGNIDALYGDKGQMTVVRSKGGQILSHGTVEARLQHAIRDLAYFHSISDQVETGLSIMIGLRRDVSQPVSLCRGLLIQALPACDLERFEQVRRRLESEEVRAFIGHDSDADVLFESAINCLVDGIADSPGLQFHEHETPRFECTCTRDKMGAVLRTLPYGERMSMVKKKEDVAVNCQFCSKRYVLTLDDCIKAWNSKPV